MKVSFLFTLVLGTICVTAQADSTFLAQKTIPVSSTRSSEVIDRTLDDMRMVFQKFEMALDSQTKIVTPKKVTGSAGRPVMTVTVRKCILFICETMDLEAAIDAREVSGKCDRNFMITANLSRSSEKVREVYDRLDTNVCYKAIPDGKGTLLLVGYAHHASTYQEGFIQKELFKMLQLQVAPLVKAVQETLKAKE